MEKKSTSETGTPAKPGRPRFIIDFDEVAKLASIHCTIREIATILGCSASLLEKEEEFMQVYKKGLETGNKSLRRLQFEKAEGRPAELLRDPDTSQPLRDDKGRPIISKPGYAPDTTMQIWLGKQHLGQADNTNVRINDDKPVTVIIKNYEKDRGAGEKAGE